jgi:uncharacterized protein YjbI with pentapeptide repeats
MPIAAPTSRKKRKRNPLGCIVLGVLTIGLAALIFVFLQHSFRLPLQPPQPPSIEPGQIVFFHKKEKGGLEIDKINPDGTGLAQLADNPIGDKFWVFSPDGKRYVTMDFRSGAGDLSVVNTVGGSNAVYLRRVSNDWNDATPTWSPDGTKLLYSYGSFDDDIHEINADGSNERDLTADNGTDDYEASWSPDGKRFAFIARPTRSSSTEGDVIYIQDLLGRVPVVDFSNNPNISTEPYFYWSPDGTRLSYAASNNSSCPAPSWETFVVNVDGSNLTNLGCNNISPEWSPDGKHFLKIDVDSSGESKIYVVDIDGTNAKFLAQAVLSDGIAWSPDGAQIVISDSGQLLVVNLDGSGTRQIGSPGSSSPVWTRTLPTPAAKRAMTSGELRAAYANGQRDFSGLDLTNADLSGANLSGINLINANLTRANLRGANLSDANLSSAELDQTELGDANLRHANLTLTRLSANQLNYNTDLTGADLKFAIIRDSTILDNAKLATGKITRAELEWAYANGERDFTQAVDLSGVDLHGINLKDANLRDANLSGANLTDADLTSAVLGGRVDLSHANLTRANLSYARIDFPDLTGANLAGANLYYVDLDDATLTGATMPDGTVHP